MKMGLYSIYDSAARKFSPLYEASTLEVAKRQFRIVVKKSPFASDFQLCRIGFCTYGDDNDKNDEVGMVMPRLTSLFEIVDEGKDYLDKNQQLLFDEVKNETE